MHPDAQKHIDFLSTGYSVDENLDMFHILHMYPGELAAINDVGFVDSRMFNLIGFNTDTMTKKDLGMHDGLRFSIGGPAPLYLRIFADGSTLVKFMNAVKVYGDYQEAEVAE